jgi:hypothetical protein
VGEWPAYRFKSGFLAEVVGRCCCIIGYLALHDIDEVSEPLRLGCFARRISVNCWFLESQKRLR